MFATTSAAPVWSIPDRFFMEVTSISQPEHWSFLKNAVVGGGAYSFTADHQQRAVERNITILRSTSMLRKLNREHILV